MWNIGVGMWYDDWRSSDWQWTTKDVGEAELIWRLQRAFYLAGAEAYVNGLPGHNLVPGNWVELANQLTIEKRDGEIASCCTIVE
jgi:hypothetical protein